MILGADKAALAASPFFKAGRCSRCRLPLATCFCADLPRIDLRTRIHFFSHRRELALASNTVNIASLVLSNCEVTIHGDPNVDTQNLELSGQPVAVLFPTEDSVELRPHDTPLCLLVPDGSWRQARKMVRRIALLDRAPKVHLPEGLVARPGPRLRERPREAWMSTIEAVAAAVGVLESVEAQRQLEQLYFQFAHRLRPERYR